MVLFDASFLILTFDEQAIARQATPRLKERIDLLLLDLSKSKSKILIPTPALSEFLAKTDVTILQAIHANSNIKIVSFDERAAIEAAEMTKSAIRETDKKDPVVAATWAKIKFDRQIVAIAKVEGVDAIYSTDPDVAKHAKKVDVPCFGIADLPIPPPIQESLPYSEPQTERKADSAAESRPVEHEPLPPAEKGKETQMSTPCFVIVAHDKDGNQVDSSGYDPRTLSDAARIAHQYFRGQKGCVGIIIRDICSKPEKEYNIDGDGNPIQIE